MKLRRRKVWYAPLLLACGAALLLLSLAAIALLVWLRPAAQDWQQSMRLGPVTLHVSVEKALRLASRPEIAMLFAGRTLSTAAGTWRIGATRSDTVLTCEPCTLTHPSLGSGRIRFDRVSIDFRPASRGYSGLLRLRSGTREILLPWTANVGPRRALVEISASTLPMADVVAVLGSDLPETKAAVIRGELSMQLHLQLPEHRVTAAWTVNDFHVAGLGTEALLDVALPEQCGSLSRGAFSGWLPRAVIAAEDQTFRHHPGYDARQMDAALRSNGDGNALRGASTLTQQLARLVYTGDERSPQRKLRELLYAVEMEQTLGKERILQLYLALAPWGRQLCGAENAAQRYLGKPANALTPAEAAWLASLLANPDARLRQTLSAGVDTARIARIVQGMRPMSARRRRQALAEIAVLKPRGDNCLAGVACVDLPSLVRTGG